MRNILVIESSLRGADSFSRKLTQAIVEKLLERAPKTSVRVRDLALDPAPHLDGAQLAGEEVRYSERAISELTEADAIVIGVPMINFSVPSVLKAWIDQVARAGRTFRYSDKGPEGLVKGKKVYLAIASGGVYSGGGMKSFDFTEPYLKTALGFLGMTDVTAFRVEGVSVPGVKETALEKAVQGIALKW